MLMQNRLFAGSELIVRTEDGHAGRAPERKLGGTSPPTRRIQNLVILGDATQEGDGVH